MGRQNSSEYYACLAELSSVTDQRTVTQIVTGSDHSKAPPHPTPQAMGTAPVVQAHAPTAPPPRRPHTTALSFNPASMVTPSSLLQSRFHAHL